MYFLTEITDNGSDFQALVAACIVIDGTCPDDVPIGCWNTSEVKNMDSAFRNTNLFDDSINCWNVERVTSMENIFELANSFNQPLDDWNVANVTDI